MSYESHLQSKKYFSDTATIYHKRSDGLVYDFSSLIFKRRNEIVYSFLPTSHKKEKILDFGMGPGVFAKHSVENGFSYIGIDISSEMVERARALKLENTKFEVGDIESLKQYEAQVDYVLAIGLIDYVEKPSEVIKLLANCTNNNGHIVISFRNRYSFPGLLRDATKLFWNRIFNNKVIKSDKVFFTEQHEHSFNFSTQILPILKELGFNNFKVNYFNCSPVFFNFPLKPWIWNIWFKIDSKIACHLTKIFCSGFVVCATKGYKK